MPRRMAPLAGTDDLRLVGLETLRVRQQPLLRSLVTRDTTTYSEDCMYRHRDCRLDRY